MDSKKYFFLAWTEEQLNCDAAALLLYLSSFCSSLEEGPASLSAGTINKIAHLRKTLSLSVREFLPLVHTYSDTLTDIDCRRALVFALDGNIHGITSLCEGRVPAWSN